jgi:hypothetical protein
MDITLDRTFLPNRDAIVRELAGEAVILHLTAGTYFGLNGVGTRIWQLLETDGHLRQVFDALCREYDAPPAEIERDLLDLVSQLVQARLGDLR